MDFLTLWKRAWLQMGLSGSPPPSVEDVHSMHARVVDWVREADVHIQQLHYNWSFLWKEAETHMQVGQHVYTPKELGIKDFNHLIRLSVSKDMSEGWERLRLMPFDPLHHPGEGIPGRFVIYPNGQWGFDKAPDKVYQLAFEYYRTPKELSGNFDEPLIPEEWQHGIIHSAKMLYAMYDEAPSDLQSANMEYQSTLTRMESRLLPPVEFADNPFTQAVV